MFPSAAPSPQQQQQQHQHQQHQQAPLLPPTPEPQHVYRDVAIRNLPGNRKVKRRMYIMSNSPPPPIVKPAKAPPQDPAHGAAFIFLHGLGDDADGWSSTLLFSSPPSP